MNNTQKIISILVGLIFSILAITNPSEQEHRNAVVNQFIEQIDKDKVSSRSDEEVQYIGFGIQIVTNSLVHRENYVIFSLTKISYQGESRLLGYGVLGRVYIDENIIQ